MTTFTLSKYNVDHYASTGTSRDILNHVSLEGGLRIETGKSYDMSDRGVKYRGVRKRGEEGGRRE